MNAPTTWDLARCARKLQKRHDGDTKHAMRTWLNYWAQQSGLYFDEECGSFDVASNPEEPSADPPPVFQHTSHTSQFTDGWTDTNQTNPFWAASTLYRVMPRPKMEEMEMKESYESACKKMGEVCSWDSLKDKTFQEFVETYAPKGLRFTTTQSQNK